MADIQKAINKYRIKEGTTIEDILKELKAKDIPNAEGGSWVNKNAYHVFWKVLVSSIEVDIALPKDLSEWDDFDYVLVMDDDFGQPYTPFYGKESFHALLNIIGHYNKFMDSLDFLERRSEEE